MSQNNDEPRYQDQPEAIPSDLIHHKLEMFCCQPDAWAEAHEHWLADEPPDQVAGAISQHGA
ncbi:hypothetical protein AA309_15605 [Microvirga vignae]|uniref:Uncharacterized protein n=1 Tax=Microvirga vignae TaxID=1225564 RepID=A0A0H1RAY5_9HYPH|nr:hypothetical protein AA309_15605 [Microvirga vignae]